MFGSRVGGLLLTGTGLSEDELDRVAIKVLDRGVEAVTFIVAVTWRATGSASSLEGAGIAAADLGAVVCGECDVGWCDECT